MFSLSFALICGDGETMPEILKNNPYIAMHRLHNILSLTGMKSAGSVLSGSKSAKRSGRIGTCIDSREEQGEARARATGG